MLGLLPSLVVLFLAVALLLWAGTLVWQSYIYSEPVAQLYWRAPAASLALVLFVTFWCFLDYKTPEGYNPTLLIFEPGTRHDQVFMQFWSVKRGQKILYKGEKDTKGRMQYRANGKLWSRSDAEGIVEAIIVKEDDQEIRFNADLTPDGKFRAAQGEPVRYIEEGGRREMTDDYIGRLVTSRRGTVLLSMLLCLLHLGVWFSGLWLLLRYQWSHAFGLALIGWLILTLIVMPMLFRKTEDLAREKAQAQTATSSADFSSMPRCA